MKNYPFPFIIAFVIRGIIAVIDSTPFLILIARAKQITFPIKNSIAKLTIVIIIIKSSNFIPLIIRDSLVLKVIPIPLSSTCNSTIMITLDYPSCLAEEGTIIDLAVITTA